MADNEFKLGATGKFPEGKLTDDDEGEIRLAIGAKDGNVVIDFGQPVCWTAMPPDAALKFAAALIEKAKSLLMAQKAKNDRTDP